MCRRQIFVVEHFAFVCMLVYLENQLEVALSLFGEAGSKSPCKSHQRRVGKGLDSSPPPFPRAMLCVCLKNPSSSAISALQRSVHFRGGELQGISLF